MFTAEQEYRIPHHMGASLPFTHHAHVDKEFPTTNMFRVKVNFALRLSVIRQLQLPVVRGSPLFAVCNECRCRWGVTWTFLHSPNFNLICFDLQSRLSVGEIPTWKKELHQHPHQLSTWTMRCRPQCRSESPLARHRDSTAVSSRNSKKKRLPLRAR